MTTIVFEQVPMHELPAAWRHQLAQQAPLSHSPVTIRIDAPDSATTDQPFNWLEDSLDLADVAGYRRTIRTPQYDFTPTGDGD